LLRYVIRYGERVLFSTAEVGDENSKEEHVVKVAEYIRSELQDDGIEILTPIYRQILDEAVAQCEDAAFTASRYFLAHPDLEISRIAADMMSTKYRLSKYFADAEDQTATLSAGEPEAESEARKRKKEREQLERWIVHDIFTLKNAYIKHKIDEINKQIRDSLRETDDEKVTELLRERMKLDEIKRLVSKEIGERIITGIGK
jgi:DNA primase